MASNCKSVMITHGNDAIALSDPSIVVYDPSPGWEWAYGTTQAAEFLRAIGASAQAKAQPPERRTATARVDREPVLPLRVRKKLLSRRIKQCRN